MSRPFPDRPRHSSSLLIRCRQAIKPPHKFCRAVTGSRGGSSALEASAGHCGPATNSRASSTRPACRLDPIPGRRGIAHRRADHHLYPLNLGHPHHTTREVSLPATQAAPTPPHPVEQGRRPRPRRPERRQPGLVATLRDVRLRHARRIRGESNTSISWSAMPDGVGAAQPTYSLTTSARA